MTLDDVPPGLLLDPAYPVNWDHPLNAGLMAWWFSPPGAPINGNVFRDLCGNYPLTATNYAAGGRRTTPTPRGDTAAYVVDASAGKAFVSATLAPLPATFSFEAWVFADSGGTANDGRFAELHGLLLGFTSGSPWSITQDGGAFPVQNAAANLARGVWYHLAFTYSGSGAGGIQMYTNGKLDTGTATAVAAANLDPFSLGSVSGFNGFTGSVGNGRLYANRVLTPADVMQAYLLSSASYRGIESPLRVISVESAALPAVTGVAFDAVSNSAAQVAQTTYTWSHTCTGANRFLAVDVSLLSAGQTVTGITYNGVALSPITGASGSTVTSFGRVECWGLVNPASGANTIAVTLSGSVTSAATAVSYTGVNQSAPTEAGNFAQATNIGAADATVMVTTIADQCWGHAAIVVNDDAVTAGQTSRNNVSSPLVGSGCDEDTGPLTAATGQAMTYTAVDAAKTWAIAGYAIRPVGAANAPADLSWYTPTITVFEYVY